MFKNKPIIGLAGGIGSGKSLVAKLFGELGCHVIDSDQQVRQAYRDPSVLQTLRQWWPGIVSDDGAVDKAAIARKIFSSPAEKLRLEQLLHPRVNAAREAEMKKAVENPNIVAFVWDAPLLFEVGLNKQCDVVVFVDSPETIRAARVKESRGWGLEELKQREISQWPLDKKREISDYVLSNTADAAQARDQVRDLFPQILAQVAAMKGSAGHCE